jgi:hypothetical protein
MRISPEAIECTVPFANERQLQRFVVENAQRLLGLQVIASTLPKGRPLHKVDILAIDEVDRVHIIECKWDAIDSGAVAQLSGYSQTIQDRWATVEERIAEYRERPIQRSQMPPVLVAIGYRQEGVLRVQDPAVEVLLFHYHGQAFEPFVDSQVSRAVSIRAADARGEPSAAHPEVLKTQYAEEHLEGLPAPVRELFWRVDRCLRNDEIRPKYSGKKTRTFVSYRSGRRLIATASIGTASIDWHCSGERQGAGQGGLSMDANTDCDEVVRFIKEANEAV